MRHFNLTQGKHHDALMAKLNRLTEDQKHFCSRAENFAHHFTMKKLFERIQILNV